jgi:multiple antibiotic resistance protein
MMEILGFFVVALTTLFVIVEPFGVVPLFTVMMQGRSVHEVRRTALRASVIGGAVLIAFAFAGRIFLDVLGVRIDSFRVAGGLLLLLAALDMLRGKKVACRCTPEEMEDAKEKEDVAVVPLAIPLLSGPGAMAATMMLMSRASGAWQSTAVIVAIVITFLVAWIVLRSATTVGKFLGPSIMAATQRVLGLVLAATSVQFILEGGANLLRRVAT